MADRNREPRRSKAARTRADSDNARDGRFWSSEPPHNYEDRAPEYHADYEADEIRPFGVSREYPRRPSPPPLWMPTEGAQRGSYYGLGPKGYRRSDERIREEVSDRLMTHPDVDASDIEVHVENGIITLSGTVEDRHQKRIAEFVAEDIVGVDDVHNRLTVRRGFWSGRARDRAADDTSTHESERASGAASKIGGRANAARAAATRDEQAH